jgi:hypothetical protein
VCVFLLLQQLLYLDNIDFGVLNVPRVRVFVSWVPRVRVYDKHRIQEFIAMDEHVKKKGVFGQREVMRLL